MGCEWQSAKEGFVWGITEVGLTKPRIAEKFKATYKNKKQYRHKCPTAWVMAGYIEEVKDGKK